ncbi:isoaspartyl peptidase/L-asparaginase [candidate division WOR-3 bacterium]|nr:isoaspartyl peptidase/L-asparaginase [candidate division WOR-3 bacterium]
MRKQIAIIAHGGAGGIAHPQRRLNGLKKAVQAGYDILRQGGSSLDAAERSVIVLEDTSVFNAGTGSYLNLAGEVEMDASIMTSDLKFGAVGAIRDVKNPVSIARMVMERTDHLLLCGENATRFARLMGAKYHDPRTGEKVLIWRRKKRRRESTHFTKFADFIGHYGTVGAVAIDQNGMISAATSSGGINLKLPGRVGDTPVIGAGTYADRNGGVSATGHGEEIMRQLLAYRVVALMARMRAMKAGRIAIAQATRADCQCGIIGISKNARILCLHNTRSMSWCYIKNGTMRHFSRRD